MKSNIMNEHKLHIEILRIMAAFFVIFNHTGQSGYSLFMSYESNSLRYWLYLLISVICKINVPIFYMITGALLLKKNESFKRVICRFLKIVVTLVIFSVLAYAQQIYLGNEIFNLKRFFKVFITSEWATGYWYLYAYAALMLMLPFLRALVRGMQSNEYYIYLIILGGINGIVTTMEYIFWKGDLRFHSSFSLVWILSNCPFYLLIGYWCENIININKINKRILLKLWGINFIGIIMTCYMTYYNILQTGNFTQNFMTSYTVFNCLAIYITIKYSVKNIEISKLIKGIVISLGRSTFGIYLIHTMLLREWRLSIWSQFSSKNGFNISFPLTHILIRCLEIMFIGYILTKVMKKCPILNKIV